MPALPWCCRVCGSADLQVGMVISFAPIFACPQPSLPTRKSALRLPPNLPLPAWRAVVFGEMLCEHLRCRLESRRAQNADLEVGAPGGAPGIPLPSLFSPCLPCRLESRRARLGVAVGVLAVEGVHVGEAVAV